MVVKYNIDQLYIGGPVDKEYWQNLIDSAVSDRFKPVVARTPLHKFDTFSEPVLFRCDDGQNYVVKGRQAGRVLVNDHIVGRLGGTLGAPVGQVAVVDVPWDLLKMNTHLQFMHPGESHGCLWIDGCSDLLSERLFSSPNLENRPRFASLAVLYGWTKGCDHQVLYKKSPPGLVFSVDHGHFLGGPAKRSDFFEKAEKAIPDQHIMDKCGLGKADLKEPLESLKRIDDFEIAKAVAGPPPDWNFLPDERLALAMWLAKRRHDLIELLTTL